MNAKMGSKISLVGITCVAIFVLTAAGLTLAQQPVPKPVTPPPVVPGQKPPRSPAVPQPPPGQAENAQPAAATDRAAQSGEDVVVQPFLDDNALAVVRVDAASINLQQARQWLTDALAQQKPEAGNAKLDQADIDRGFDHVSDWITRFTKAGGKRLYVIASLNDLPDHPPFIVVPLERGVDAANLMAVFTGEKNPGAATNRPDAIKINDSTIVAGDMATLNRLKQAAAAKPKADLARAFAAAEQGPVRLAVIPGQGVRQMLAALAPQLPEELGGGPITSVTLGLRWIALSPGALPQPTLKVIIQARDAGDAKTLQTLAQKSADALKDRAAQWQIPFDVERMATLMMPKIQGDRLVVSLDADQTKTLLGSIVAPTLVKMRQNAAMVASANNMRQILIGCVEYSSKHDNRWPDSLDEIADQVGGKEALAKITKDPDHPEEATVYTYRKPTHLPQDAERTIVLYESHAQWPNGILVGFADGHVEHMNSEEQFKKLLEVGQ